MRYKIFVVLALFAISLSGCNLPASMTGAGSGSVSIVLPLDGAQLNVGDFVDVKSLVDYPSGATSATLFVNDAAYRVDALNAPMINGSLYQPWTPTEPGTYTLYLRASGADGEADSNSVTVIVETVVPAEVPTLSIAPTVVTPTTTPFPNVTVTKTPTVTRTPFFPSATPPILILMPTAMIQANGVISGKVYRDENGNGSFNPADAPLAGVTVQLGAGACPSSGIQTTQTGGDGKYTFSALPAGQYCITVDTGSLPAIGGTWQPSLPNPNSVNLTAGENIGGRNFMFQPIIQ